MGHQQTGERVISIITIALLYRINEALTVFEGGLNLLHKADDDAVIWLESAATAALAK